MNERMNRWMDTCMNEWMIECRIEKQTVRQFDR